MDETPDNKSRAHLQRAVGEVGERADSIDQSKTDGHQREGKTIDDSVN